MNKCPITYEDCGEKQYSEKGLKILSPKLHSLDPLPFTAIEQRQEAAIRATKMSIQGVQPKLTALLRIKSHHFEFVNSGGTYILKPPSDFYSQTAENEDLTMKLAKCVGIDVPVHGMVYAKDNSLTYFIKRFDRYGKGEKYRVEDFSQLTLNDRETKYNWSMEKLIPVINTYCTFPSLEKVKLFHRTLFCFLTGNEDMHLKNFSLLTKNNITALSPAYDLINTTIILPLTKEELALPLRGKKNKMKWEDFIEYFGKDKLGLSDASVKGSLKRFSERKIEMVSMINRSFLSEDLKKAYRELFFDRCLRLNIV